MQELIKLFSTLSYKALCTLRIELFLWKKKPTKSSLNSAFLPLIIKLTKERQCFLCDGKFSYSFLSLKYLHYFFKFFVPLFLMCSPSWTLLPLPSPYHPSGSSQCTSPKHPASCIEPGLASRFIHDILSISISTSGNIRDILQCIFVSITSSGILWSFLS